MGHHGIIGECALVINFDINIFCSLKQALPHCSFFQGTKNIDIEIYDECTFTNDAMVAHSTFSIPEDVFKFMVVDDWFPLSGQEGHEKEGVLHLILRLLETNYAGVNKMFEFADLGYDLVI